MGTGAEPNQVRRLAADKESTFPALGDAEYCVTSEEDFDYNCIAYAAGWTHARWWPIDGIEGVEWPAGAPLEETLDAFVSAYVTEGYEECSDPDPEEGYEKVAIFVGDDDVPTHAARQTVPAGEWVSKLGGWEDIRHETLEALEGADPAYGRAVRFMRRKIRGPFYPPCLPPTQTSTAVTLSET